MGNYKTKVSIEISESDETISPWPEEIETGVFELILLVDRLEMLFYSHQLPL